MDKRHEILFEPIKIGPVTTKNRFYQVPHCSGMGHRYPEHDLRLREMKAEGGWGVVSTQETEIHPTSDITPSNQWRIWDEKDAARLQNLTDAVHQHGSLAAIQLVHNGIHVSNRLTRLAPLGPMDMIVDVEDPVQARAMDKADIARFRKWHRDAALRAKRAGFDIIYVYAGHDMTLLQHFLLQRYNTRTDEYGGSFENRLRLFREVLADTRDAVGDKCAIAVRFAVEEFLGDQGIQHNGEGRDVIAALADEPDLWDVNLSGWSNDSQTSRFSQEGFQEPYISFVKSLTSKPVVGVGRYTSPDTMVQAIRSGILDLIGAARPSIADPFLPEKIRNGRVDDIRECIGCNICTASDNIVAPLRCTQNPTIGEEARKGWHPEKIGKLRTAEKVLVVGGGPAGLEAARAMAERGADVIIADKSTHWGGRVTEEAALPGLASWARVRDWRMTQLQRATNVEMYLDSNLDADEILTYGIPHVVLATGAHWRTDAVGRSHRQPFCTLEARTLSVNAILKDKASLDERCGPLVIFDDDRYYLGSVLAELAASRGIDTTLVTPAPIVAPWSEHTLEQSRVQTRLIELGVGIIPLHKLAKQTVDSLSVACIYSGRETEIPCGTLVPVTSRHPDKSLSVALEARRNEWQDAGIKSVTPIGDCYAPSIIAAAVYGGHSYARGFGVSASENMDSYR